MYKFFQLYGDDIVDKIQLRMDDILQLEETRREYSIQNTKLHSQIKHLY